MTDDKDKEVRIHIDRKPYDSPRKTTGAALYKLGSVAAGYELFREVTGDREDELISDSEAELTVHEDEHFYSAKQSLNPG